MSEFRNFQKELEKDIKLEGCKIGEHNWSGAFCCASGLARECLICHALKEVEWTEKEKDLWLNKRDEGTEWVKEKLDKLNHKQIDI